MDPILNDMKTLQKLKEVSGEDGTTILIEEGSASPFIMQKNEAKGLKKIILKTLNQIFPPKCCMCNHINEKAETSIICDDCRNIYSQYEVDKEFYNEKGKVIGFGIFRYDGIVRYLIQKMKFKKDKKIAYALGDLSEKKAREFLSKHHVNFIVPIPIHKDRLKERGFNQTEIIAKVLSEKTGVPMRTDIVGRTRYTVPQSKLKNEERRDNVKDSFEILNDFDLNGKDIFLVDDIYTTGSTIEECSKVLYEHNTRKVYFLSVSVSNNKLKGEVNDEN